MKHRAIFLIDILLNFINSISDESVLVRNVILLSNWIYDYSASGIHLIRLHTFTDTCIPRITSRRVLWKISLYK